MKDVKYVDIVLENCEIIRLRKHCLGRFLISGIKSDISRIACNCIAKCDYADTVVMEILKNAADEDYTPFGQEGFDKTNKIKRLSEYNDITSIQITYIDKTSDTIYVNYDEGEDEGILGAANINQKNYLSNTGNLYIVIEKDKNIEDYFDMDDIENNEDIKPTESRRFEYSETSLPNMYKYVYLYKGEECEKDYQVELAVRVYDKDLGWKFVYEDGIKGIEEPTEWCYPYDDLYEFIEEENEGTDFSIDALLKKYPVPDEAVLTKDHLIDKVWAEAKQAADEHNKKQSTEAVVGVLNDVKKKIKDSIQETTDLAGKAATKAEEIATKGIDRIKKHIAESNANAEECQKKTAEIAQKISEQVEKFKKDAEASMAKESKEFEESSTKEEMDDEEKLKHMAFSPVSKKDVQNMLDALERNEHEMEKENDTPSSRNTDKVETPLQEKTTGKKESNIINPENIAKAVDKAEAILEKATKTTNKFIQKAIDKIEAEKNEKQKEVKIPISGDDE